MQWLLWNEGQYFSGRLKNKGRRTNTLRGKERGMREATASERENLREKLRKISLESLSLK